MSGYIYCKHCNYCVTHPSAIKFDIQPCAAAKAIAVPKIDFIWVCFLCKKPLHAHLKYVQVQVEIPP